MKGVENEVTKKFLVHTILILTILLTACGQHQADTQQQKKFESEPEITVELADGNSEKIRLEEYVAGVVAGEMKADWPENAYAAQAILARTFALKYMEENQTRSISSSYAETQQYKPENISEVINNAVKKTRGQVVFHDDQYIKGWFHASAGGETTTARVGLAYEKEEPPYVKSTESPDNEAPEDVKNWKIEFSLQEINVALAEEGLNTGEINNIKISEKDNSGRAVDIVISGSKDEEKIKAANFRKALGSKKLKSTKINKLEKTSRGFYFEGNGYGHGVGLSQWGAYALAKDKKSVEEIIKYYYKNIEIKEVY